MQHTVWGQIIPFDYTIPFFMVSKNFVKIFRTIHTWEKFQSCSKGFSIKWILQKVVITGNSGFSEPQSSELSQLSKLSSAEENHIYILSTTNLVTSCNIAKFYHFPKSLLNQEPLKLPGRKTRLKNFKTLFFQKYLKFLLCGRWYVWRTSPKNFWKNISTNMVARAAFLSFGILKRATDPLIK